MLFLFACPAPEDSAEPQESETSACIADPLTAFPADQEANAYWKTPIEFAISQPDATAEVVTDIPGHVVISEDGRVYRWVPDGALEPHTSYTVTLKACFGEMVTTFTTGAYGDGLSVDPESLEGREFELDLLEGRSDSQVATLIRPYLMGKVRVRITDVRDRAMTVQGQYSFRGDFSDVCDVGTQYAVFDRPPAFITIPTDLPFPSLYDFRIDGTLSADGEEMLAHVEGQWDVRDLSKIEYDIGYTPDQLCGVMAAAALPCQPCQDGENYCMNLSASLVPGKSKEPIVKSDQQCTSCASASGPAFLGVFAGLGLLLRARPARVSKSG